MHHYVKIALILCACLALTTAQFGHYGFSDFATSFGGPTYSNFAAAARDPRANTGPVLFPPSPMGAPGQTSGVVVGASGYGFVPPGSQASQKHQPPQAQPRHQVKSVPLNFDRSQVPSSILRARMRTRCRNGDYSIGLIVYNKSDNDSGPLLTLATSSGGSDASRHSGASPEPAEGLRRHKSSYENRHKRKLCAFPNRRA